MGQMNLVTSIGHVFGIIIPVIVLISPLTFLGYYYCNNLVLLLYILLEHLCVRMPLVPIVLDYSRILISEVLPLSINLI